MTGRGSRALVLAVTVAMLAMTTIVRADAASPPQSPDANVKELTAFANDIVPAGSGVPLFIGAGTAQQTGVVSIHSLADLIAMVSAPSPILLAAVYQFYVQGGSDAFVLTVATEDAPAFSAALTAVTPAGTPPGWDLIVIPALGSLTPTDWLTTAAQMIATAGAAKATAILDPPDATVAAAQSGGAGPLSALGLQLRDAVSSPANAVLLSSGFTDEGDNPVPGAAAMAGIIAATDLYGVWATPGGPDHPVFGGLQPVLMVNDALDQALAYPAMINSWRVLPGYGTILFGTLTLQGEGTYEWINRQRTVSWIQRSIAPALESYVFAPNDATTWSAVNTSISTFLTSVWKEGGLVGPSAAASFTVSAGIGSTMTAQDILNGLMNVSVELRLSYLVPPVIVMFQQQMQA